MFMRFPVNEKSQFVDVNWDEVTLAGA